MLPPPPPPPHPMLNMSTFLFHFVSNIVQREGENLNMPSKTEYYPKRIGQDCGMKLRFIETVLNWAHRFEFPTGENEVEERNA